MLIIMLDILRVSAIGSVEVLHLQRLYGPGFVGLVDE
jgi:hypothetical protein